MFSNSTSDETVLRLRRKWEVSERVLEPLEMSDTEIVCFIATNCESVEWMGNLSTHFPCGWRVRLDGGETVSGTSLEKAVGAAKAIYNKEANQ